MKALRATEGQVGIFDIGKPRPEGEALVRVMRSGICNTDLELVKGYAGFSGTLGHEFVGVVEDAGGVPGLAGTRVVGEINAGCGECERCRGGDSRHCPRRTVLGIVGRDGAHAEFLKLPGRNLLPVPDSISDEEAVFAEPLAAAIGITEQVEILRETKVAVIGDGKLGLLCALSLARHSENVTLLGRHVGKLRIAADAGIETRIAAGNMNAGKSFDVVVEASGSSSGFTTAVDLVRPRGKIVLKSTFHGPADWPAARIVVEEVTVVGSRCGRLAPALAALEEGSIDVRPLISDEFRLADGVRAMEEAGRRGVLKVLLDMSK